jgi:flagellar biosynthetic protein FliR
LLVGFVATLALAGLTMAGTLVGNAIGLNAAQLLNPLTGEQATVMDQFYTMLAGLVFLSLGGHHWLILAMAQTMRFAPVGTFQVDPRILADLMPLSANVFVTAMRVALPVFGTVILTDMALATIARAVPQMNIFIVGLPLKAFVALAMLIVTLPLMESMITRIIREGMGHLANLLAVP